MDQNLAIFLLLAVAIAAAVTLMVGLAKVRATVKIKEYERRAAGDADQLTGLATENEALRARLGRQDDRLAVLERIATDPAERTAREIENLRHN